MYTIELQKYRAIKKASIRIDGITVLAGINGSGKSTLSRWLYYLINATHDFEQYQRLYFIESLEQQVEKVNRFFRITSQVGDYLSVKSQLNRFRLADNFDFDELERIYYAFIKKAEEDLNDYVRRHPINNRLTNFLLDKEINGEFDSRELIDTFLHVCRETYKKGYDKYKYKVNASRMEDLAKVIMFEYSAGEQMPVGIGLLEDETSLLGDETFSPPLMLSRAIYIDTPMAVSMYGYSLTNDIWADFVYHLYNENTSKTITQTDRFDNLIQSVIGGNIQLTPDKMGIKKELHFVSKELGIDIDVKDVATGIKSFAYISQLLHNGWLDKETLLMIDEPEAHLHPQWIVEFARLLVKIHKELGVKILVASHNPDMVAAIQSIARKEDLINKTRFYLSQKGKYDTQYEYSDKGTEISDIFSSFNIALSRIEMYGTPII